MSTKTSVNPATKRSEVHSRRRRWPASCSTPTPEMSDVIVSAVMRAPESPARPPAAACRASLDGLELGLELRLRRGADDRGLHLPAAVDEERRRDPRDAPGVAD